MNLINDSKYYLDYLDESKELKELNKQIKKDSDKITQGFIPTILEYNNFIICLKYKYTNEISSFIHFTIRDNIKEFPEHIYIIYSYTFIKYRKQGLNKMLRLVLEDICKLNDINALVSLPFPEAESRIVMSKLGYSNENGDLFFKYIR